MFEKRMPNNFELPHDIEARLNRTICSYDGEPYRIETDGMSVYLIDLLGRNTPVKVDAHDPLLDISSLELGYMNIEPGSPGRKTGFCEYLTRGPGKQWKQGICIDRIEVHSPVDDLHTPLSGVDYVNLYNVLKNIYPSVTEAVWNISSGLWESVAISRDVCLMGQRDSSISVVHLRDPIGVLIPGRQKVYVKEHEHLWCVEKILRRFNIEVDPFKVESHDETQRVSVSEV